MRISDWSSDVCSSDLALANNQIRRGVLKGLRRCDRSPLKPAELFPVLQSGALAPSTGLPDSGSSLFFEHSQGLWKMARLMEIRKKRGFPQSLGKAFGFPTFPTGPTTAIISHGPFNFQGRRSTLDSPVFCLKDGEYLNPRSPTDHPAPCPDTTALQSPARCQERTDD